MEENQSTGSAPGTQSGEQNENVNTGTGDTGVDTATGSTDTEKAPEQNNTGEGEDLAEDITAGTEAAEQHSAQQRDTGNLRSDGILKD